MKYSEPSDYAKLLVAIHTYISVVKTMEEYPATYHLDKMRQDEHKRILSHFEYNDKQKELANNVLHNMQLYSYDANNIFDELHRIRDNHELQKDIKKVR
ncbi:MAG: hypothetical protein WC783_00190 [Candidatus Paceibacterota bacterium]|jgi:hypothetical protein